MEKHPIFDTQYWAKKQKLLTAEISSFASIISPVHAILYDKLLTAAAPMADERVPVDVFVFGLGAPKSPQLTKIGGVPFRPKDQAWPSRDGVALNFIGQICFTDSFDIVSRDDCSGDVLLVFKDIGFSYYYLEWQRSDLRGELCTKSEAEGTIFRECFGERWRTCDVITEPNATDNLVTQGLKIGGIVPDNDHGYTGRLLGSITSFSPVTDCDFPFVNVETPISFSELGEDMLFVDPLEMWVCCFRKSSSVSEIEQINFERALIYT